MRTRKGWITRAFLVALSAAITTGAAFGQAVWVGAGSTENFNTPANWQGGVVPPINGSTAVDFSSTATYSIMNLVASTTSLQGISFLGSSGYGTYTINANEGSQLAIGPGGISPASGFQGYLYISTPTVLSVAQTWNAGTAFIDDYGALSGTGPLTTEGSVYLTGSNSFTGGVNVSSGELYVGSGGAGTGTINLASGTYLESYYNTATLANPVAVAANVTLGNNGIQNNFGNQGASPQLYLSGPVTFTSAATTIDLNFNTSVDLQGVVTGPPSTQLAIIGQTAMLPYDGGSQVVIEGSLSNITGVNVQNASLILAPAGSATTSFSSISGSGLQVGPGGATAYLGLDGTFSSQAGAVSAFISTYGASLGATINGTLGFDTFANPSTPATFNDPINLTAFTSPNFIGLGSASAAILGASAVITPYNQNYKFGGGGGTLTVLSPLADSGGPTSLTMGAAPEPLTLVLEGLNTYTGGTYVNDGVLVFGSAPPATGAITLGPGAYVGYNEGAGIALAQTFVGMVTPVGSGGIIGFDSQSVSSPRTISDAIDLSGYNVDNNPFIGTSTAVTLAGTITPAAGAYQFTAVKGGSLTIASALTGENSVTIGLVNPVETNGSTSVVNITGSGNTYSGNTTFNSGTLFVLNTSSLGTGTIVVPDSGGSIPTPYLAPFSYSPPQTLTLANPISLSNIGGAPGMNVGSAYTQDLLVLSGNISDYTESTGVLGVTGANTYSGGTVITSNYNGYTQINVTNSQSLGSGPLAVNAPAILAASGANVTLPNYISLTNELTLGETGSAYTLTLNGVISGGSDLNILSNVALGGDNTYSGGTFINNAIVTLLNSGALGTGQVQLENSTLSFGYPNPVMYDLTGNAEGVIALTSGSSLTLNTDTVNEHFDYYGSITGDATNSVIKTGSGIEFLYGPSTYAGGTTINDGALIAAANTALGPSGTVTVTPGTTLGVASGATLSNPVTLNTGAALVGSGTFSIPGGVTISGGTAVVPGLPVTYQRIGTLTFGTAVDFGPSGTYQFNVANAGGVAGTDYSTINVTGTLTISSTPGSPFVINLTSIDPVGGDPGLATFSSTTAYSWTLLSAGAITGFAANVFAVNTSGFQNLLNGGSLAVVENGSQIDLNFTPVPEPGTWAMIALGIGGMVFAKAIRQGRRAGKS